MPRIFPAIAAAGLTLTIGVGSFYSAPAALVDPLTIVREAASMDKLIEGLMAEIRTSKSLPGWAVNAAMNAYAVYTTYRNGEKVEEINATVLAVLKEVADIKADADKGREMTEREYRLTRELLDSYTFRLQGYEKRLASVERDVKIIRNQLAPWRYRSRLCQAAHEWRPNLGRCVHISVAGPRR